MVCSSLALAVLYTSTCCMQYSRCGVSMLWLCCMLFVFCTFVELCFVYAYAVCYVYMAMLWLHCMLFLHTVYLLCCCAMYIDMLRSVNDCCESLLKLHCMLFLYHTLAVLCCSAFCPCAACYDHDCGVNVLKLHCMFFLSILRCFAMCIDMLYAMFTIAV